MKVKTQTLLTVLTVEARRHRDLGIEGLLSASLRLGGESDNFAQLFAPRATVFRPLFGLARNAATNTGPRWSLGHFWGVLHDIVSSGLGLIV